MPKITQYPSQSVAVGATVDVANLEDFYSHLLRNLQPQDTKYPQGFTLATFRGNHREKPNYLESTGFIAIDFEGPKDAVLTQAQLDEAVQTFAEYEHIFYTSRSHLQPGKGARGRLILTVSPAPETREQHEGLVRYLFQALPEGTFDAKCFDVTRLFFYPPEDANTRYSEGPPIVWDPSALPRDLPTVAVHRPTEQLIDDEKIQEFVEVLRPKAVEAEGARNNLAMWVLGALKQTGAPTETVRRAHDVIFEGYEEHLSVFEARWEHACSKDNLKIWGAPATDLEGLPAHKADGLYQLLGMQLGAEVRRLMHPGAMPAKAGVLRGFPKPEQAYQMVKSMLIKDAVDVFLATHFPESMPLKHHQGCWYFYDGRCYQPAEPEKVRALVQAFYCVAVGQLTKNNQQGTPQILTVPLYTNKLNAVLSEAMSLIVSRCTSETGPRKDLVCVANGVLDAKLNRFQPHSPEHFVVGCMPWSFLSEPTDTPELDGFYERCGFTERQRAAHLEALGYACFGNPEDQQKAVLFTGPPRAGKGTSGELITHIVGLANVSAQKVSNLGERFGLELAIDKKVLYFDDVLFEIDQRHASRSGVIEMILSGTTGTKVFIDRKREKPLQASLGVMVMCSNRIPTFGGGNALASRLHVVPFKRSFVGSEDRDLLSRMLEELDAIARRAWDAWQSVLVRRSFTVAEDTVQILEEVKLGGSSVSQFANAWLKRSQEGKAGGQEMYDRYRAFCEDRGIKQVASRSQFIMDLVSEHQFEARIIHGKKFYRCELLTEEVD